MVTNDRQLNTIYITTEKTFNKKIYISLIIVSELDSFLLLAKIKGKVALALLAAPSYVHVPSSLQAKWPKRL
jgi:hypothetical protein